MKKSNFISKFLLIFVMFSTMVLLSGCSPEYMQQQALSSYNSGDYLHSAGTFKLMLETQPDNPNNYFWIGKNYSAVGDYDTAIINFKKAIDLSAQNTTYKTDLGSYYLNLANAYYGNIEYQEAAATLKKLNEIDSTVCVKPENLYKCTEIYENVGQIKEAMDLHNRYAYPQEYIFDKYVFLSYLNIRDHNYDTAVNMAVKAIEQKPDNEQAYYNFGMISGARGQHNKAIDTLRKAIQIKRTDISPRKFLPIYISLAYFLTKNGEYDAAIAAYNDAIQNTKITKYIHPYTVTYRTGPVTYNKTSSVSYDDYASQRTIVLIYYNMGRYDEALKLLDVYINKLDMGRAGMVIRDSAYLKAAFDFNHHIMSVKPDSPAEKAGLKFGDAIVDINGEPAKGKKTEDIVSQISGPIGTEVTLKIKRYENPVKKEGEFIFEKKLVRETTKDKNNLDKLAKAYGLRSLIYRAKGETEKAISDAQKAINFNPESFDAKLAWGLANIDKGNYNDAVKILSTAKVPENERIYEYNLFTPFPADEELIKLGKAIAYLKLGKVNEAINYIPAKEIPPAAGPVWKEYQVLAMELTELAQLHNEKAVNLHQKGFLKEALKEYTLALTYINNDKKEEEIRNNLVNLLQEYPVAPTMSDEARKYMIRADILLKENDLSGALSECHKALKLAPYLPKIYYNIAGLNGGLKNYDKAISYMNTYLKLVPDAQDAKDEITKWELLLERK